MTEKITFEKSSGNVFEDLGLTDAEELFLRATLGFKVFQTIENRKLTQAEAAKILGVKQPEISRLKKGEFNHYSVERLMTFLNRLNARYSPIPNFFVSMEFQLIGFLSFENVLHILVKRRFLIEVKNSLFLCSKRHEFFTHDLANDFF